MNRMNKIIAGIAFTSMMLSLCTGCGASSSENATKITLKQDNICIDGSGATSNGNTVTITSGGKYEISGTLLEGQIQVNTKNEDDKVELVLDGVELSNVKESAIFEEQAGQVTITLAKGSENRISSGEESMYEEALEEAKKSTTDTEKNSESVESGKDGQETTEEVITTTKAAIYVRDDLIVSGEGSLEVNGYLNNGIQAKDDLEILSGTITVTASNDGIKSGADVTISDGTVTTTTVGDGIVASYNVTITDGTFHIKTGDGAGEVKDMGGMMPADIETEDGDTVSDKETTKENDKAETDTEDETEKTRVEEQSKDRKSRGERPDFFQQDSSQDSGASQKGIKSGATLTIDRGTFTLDTMDDAIHSNDVVVVNDGTMEIATGDDGIHADNSLTVNDGTINITQSNEGLEAIEIIINNGDIDVVSSDDGFNACGGTSSFGMGGGRERFEFNVSTEETTDTAKENAETNEETENVSTDADTTEESEDPVLTINGGDIYINAGGDGIDSNGSIYITDGNVYVDGAENGGNSAIDIGTENSGICQITGGTVVGIGYSSMAEAMDSSSTQYSLMYVFDSTVSAGTEIVISDEDGKEIAAVTTVKSCDSIIYSSKELSKGAAYTITAEDQSGELTLEESYTTNATLSGRFQRHRGSMNQNDADHNTTDGMKPNGERPQIPDGEKPSGERPQMPDGEELSGENSQVPDEQETSEDQSTNNVIEI